MIVSTMQAPKSRKRERENENGSVDEVVQQFSRIDRLTANEARRLFLESDASIFQQGLETQLSGSLRTVHCIHKKAKVTCDPAQRKDRWVLRNVKQLPDALTVGPLLSSENLAVLQKRLWSKARSAEKVPDGRLSLFYEKSQCIIGAKGSFELDFTPQMRVGKQFRQILGLLFQKAMEAAYKLDGEESLGKYKAKLFIVREWTAVKKGRPLTGMEMHHDYAYDKNDKPSQFPKYLFLAMLSDRSEKHGWEGGDLIIQNDSTSRPYVFFQNHRPYLRYQYPLNEGICVRNREVIHQRTDVLSTKSSMKIARDLLIIHLFDNVAE